MKRCEFNHKAKPFSEKDTVHALLVCFITTEVGREYWTWQSSGIYLRS